MPVNRFLLSRKFSSETAIGSLKKFIPIRAGANSLMQIQVLCQPRGGGKSRAAIEEDYKTGKIVI